MAAGKQAISVIVGHRYSGPMWPWVLATVSAIAVGVLTEVTTGVLGRSVRRLGLRLRVRRPIAFDVRDDGLFPLGEWSPNRQLEQWRVITDRIPQDDRPAQQWIDPGMLEEAVRLRAEKSSGATVYFTGFRIDHREADDTQYCLVRQAESQYPEVLAIEDLRIAHPEIFVRCDEVIERDVRLYLEAPVPSSIAVNLVVLSRDNDELLCVERSAAVDSATGWWTIGVFETMKQHDPNRPGASENIYGLAVRGLIEELGLYSGDDYGKLTISWIGLFRPILRGHIVALIRLKIPREEAVARMRAADSSYEHAAIDWLPLRHSLVSSFVQAQRNNTVGKVGSTLHVERRSWIEQSRLAVLEAWRFRTVLEE